MTKLVVAFRNFVNAPEDYITSGYVGCAVRVILQPTAEDAETDGRRRNDGIKGLVWNALSSESMIVLKRTYLQ
jgi:hypothetical protein